MLKMSRFAHFLGDKQILWHALTFVAVRDIGCLRKIDGAVCQRMKSESEWKELLGEHFELLVKGGFLVTEEQDNMLLREAIAETSSTTIQGLYLIMTSRCNLACSYCLYGASGSLTLNSEIQAKDMPEHIAETAIECFADIVRQNIHYDGYWEQITFYGGEPLLNSGSLCASIKKVMELKEKGLLWDNAVMVVNTNGLLIDDKITNLLKYGNVEVQLSIDGFRNIHDKNRYAINSGSQKTGSFGLVVGSLKKLIEADILVTPMITVTEDNLSTLDQFVVWLCREFGIRSYRMNTLMSGTGAIAENYPEMAAKKMFETHQSSARYSAHDYGFIDQLNGLSGPNIKKQECGAGRKLTVFPNGTVHTCQALEATGLTLVGGLSNFKLVGSNWHNWSQRTRFKNQHCLECPALGGCGGGCAAGSFHTAGDINSIDINKCRWTKSLFDLKVLNCTLL